MRAVSSFESRRSKKSIIRRQKSKTRNYTIFGSELLFSIFEAEGRVHGAENQAKDRYLSRGDFTRSVEKRVGTTYGEAERRWGEGRTGRRQNASPRRQPSFVPSKASKTDVLNVFPEARKNEI